MIVKQDILIDEVLSFQKDYVTSSSLQQLEQSIQKNGLEKTCLNSSLLNQISYSFNIEIPEVPIFHQQDSYQCYIYAFLRVMKSILIKYCSSHFQHVDFSASYLDFYDKLEKINTVYNKLFEQSDLTLDFIFQTVNQYIGLYGNFHYCKQLVDKYGIVFEEDMPTSIHFHAKEIIELLKNKIKSDAKILLSSPKELFPILKKKLMKEAYDFLSQIYGNPPTFLFYEQVFYTPWEWKECYLQNHLDDYITLTTYPISVLHQSFSYLPSVYLHQREIIQQVSIEQMKHAIIEQLKDSIAVWFSCEESTSAYYDGNVLDPNVFRYSDLFHISSLSQQEKLIGDFIRYDHAMCITGALLLNQEIKQFKVDNSFGNHGLYQGHFIMTNDFLEQCVITINVNKKYLH